MPKKFGPVVQRPKALWIQTFYHELAKRYSKKEKISVGEFIENCLDPYIDEENQSKVFKSSSTGTVPRDKAVWVQDDYHAITRLCAHIERITVGEFVESAIDAYVDSDDSLKG